MDMLKIVLLIVSIIGTVVYGVFCARYILYLIILTIRLPKHIEKGKAFSKDLFFNPFNAIIKTDVLDEHGKGIAEEYKKTHLKLWKSVVFMIFFAGLSYFSGYPIYSI